jgi:hypothetical protein
MRPQTGNSSSTQPKAGNESTALDAKRAAPTNPELARVQAEIDDIAVSVAELQRELHSGISTHGKGPKMPDRTLSIAAAVAEIEKDLPNFKVLLKDRNEEAVKKVTEIRARVVLKELPGFDDKLFDLVNEKK